jgi:hypothetical protein
MELLLRSIGSKLPLWGTTQLLPSLPRVVAEGLCNAHLPFTRSSPTTLQQVNVKVVVYTNKADHLQHAENQLL